MRIRQIAQTATHVSVTESCRRNYCPLWQSPQVGTRVRNPPWLRRADTSCHDARFCGKPCSNTTVWALSATAGPVSVTGKVIPRCEKWCTRSQFHAGQVRASRSGGWLARTPGSRRHHGDAAPAATRARILAAAETLFLRDGYARTSMKAIAGVAGVSEKTMHLAFATKATLLRQVIQLTLQGDEAGTPLAQRPEWRQLLSGPVEEVFRPLHPGVLVS